MTYKVSMPTYFHWCGFVHTCPHQLKSYWQRPQHAKFSEVQRYKQNGRSLLRIYNYPIKPVITSVEGRIERDKELSWEDSIGSRCVWFPRFNFRELQVRCLMSSSLYLSIPATHLPHTWGPHGGKTSGLFFNNC